jgi:hypothetical protein
VATDTSLRLKPFNIKVSNRIYNDYIVYSAIIIMSDEKKDAKGKDPMSPEKITSHEPTAVTRDPEDIKEGVAESEEESKEKLRRSGMTKGTDKA